jgi:hypothetical protein
MTGEGGELHGRPAAEPKADGEQDESASPQKIRLLYEMVCRIPIAS